MTAAQALRANESLANRGVQLFGAGFIVTTEAAARLESDAPIKPYRNGRDLTERPRGVSVIDLYGHDADEVRRRWPATYQWVLERVKSERDHNNRASYRDNWWIFGEPRKVMRATLVGLPRYIATVETAKHRVFQFLDAAIAPDNKLVCIALDDALFLGVLSSRVHVVWAMASGSWLGVGNDSVYAKSRCFETFPFPVATAAQQARIRDLAEQIDFHRKRALAAHEDLTLTGLYNVLVKVGAGDTANGAPLNAKDKAIHEKGLVAVLKSLHDELDAAVLDAYGWHDLIGQCADEQTLLERLVALNTQRRAEEAQGQVRWLRPEFQAPSATQTSMAGLGDSGRRNQKSDEATSPPAPPAQTAARAWPNTLPEQLAAVAKLLADSPTAQTEAQLAANFAGRGRWKSRLPDILEALEALGRARRLDDGRWMG